MGRELMDQLWVVVSVELRSMEGERTAGMPPACDLEGREDGMLSRGHSPPGYLL